ncbi:MAG TPA: M18 family aminopeptidase [Spongiibacteraceae bacterium]|nr:M18 family aminopeptidase [Spongiibacteraceae bacterium]
MSQLSAGIEQSELLDELLAFLRDSPTPFHAVANLVALLQHNGFQIIREGDAWQLQPGGRYIVTRNDSSLLAFVLGSDDVVANGVHIAGAHTDSPCLKIKPNPELLRQGYFQLGVEVYGGALLGPWFDRDLSLAGRVSYLAPDGTLASALVDFKKPIAIIPSLAIHLDREANSSRTINAQTQLPLVLMMTGAPALASEKGEPDFRALLLEQLRNQCGIDAREVLDYEISCYDTQAPSRVGIADEFIASARIDNLLSCFVGVRALLKADGKRTAMMVCSDHEEVGSASHAGAQGTLLQKVLRRIAGAHAGFADESYARMIDKSLLISCDNAHGIHPNFADKHDANHGPLLNQGPVIKVNANQRYATNSETAAYFRQLCSQVDAPVQSFVVRSDMACGSTIGPIVATETGINTVDVGVPQWAMHSIRETAGSRDCEYLYRVLAQFFQQ